MPIKRSRTMPDPVPVERKKPTVVPKKPKPKPKQEPKPPKVLREKPPLPKRAGIIRRRRMLPDAEIVLNETDQSPYLYEDGGFVVVRAPAECVRWPPDFRMRIIRDYTNQKWVPENNVEAFDRLIPQDKVYVFSGRRVKVLNHPQRVEPGVLYVKTEVQRLDNQTFMILRHSDPAMRTLLVYAFLKDVHIPGLPKMRIAPLNSIK